MKVAKTKVDMFNIPAGSVMQFDEQLNSYKYYVSNSTGNSESTAFISIHKDTVEKYNDYFVVIDAEVVPTKAESQPAYVDAENVQPGEIGPDEDVLTAKDAVDIRAKIEEYTKAIKAIYSMNVQAAEQVVCALRDKIETLEWVLYGE